MCVVTSYNAFNPTKSILTWVTCMSAFSHKDMFAVVTLFSSHTFNTSIQLWFIRDNMSNTILLYYLLDNVLSDLSFNVCYLCFTFSIYTTKDMLLWHGEYAVSETHIGYRCATDGIVMSSYEPVKNPLWTRSWKRGGERWEGYWLWAIGYGLWAMGYWLWVKGERLEGKGNKQKLFKINPKIN